MLTESKTAGQEPGTEFLWTRKNYEELVDRGIFSTGDRIELLDGKLITMAPQRSPHATSIYLVADYLNSVFRDGFLVRQQFPVALDDLSEPEPDVAVVRGGVRDFASRHPSADEIVLVVEVAESSLAFDRGKKLAAYARAGVPEYWIVNVPGRQIEVYLEPTDGAYGRTEILAADKNIAPAGHDAAAAGVADLLP